MVKARTPTLTSSYPCASCGSFYFKEPDMICFWCRRPRLDLIQQRKDDKVQSVVDAWLDDDD